jgi:transcriptional regulator with XRE-family HTH domain
VNIDLLSDKVADRIRFFRRDAGWNREQLADECAALGMPELTAAVLTNIESGRRTDGARRRMITIDELAVISKALQEPLVLAEEVGLSDVTRGMERAFRDVARAVVTGQMDERIALAWQVFSNSLKGGGS